MSRKSLFNAYPQLAELDNFSKFVATKVYASYPQWLAYARSEEYQGERYLCIEVPVPVNPRPRDLVITTNGSRITIHFDLHHMHPWGRTRSAMWKDAKLYLDRLLSEQIIVGIKMQGDKWIVAKSFSPETLSSIKLGEVSYTRSWLSTYDKNYEE